MAGTGSVCNSRISKWQVLDLMKQSNITVEGTGSICDRGISQWQVLDLYVTVGYHSGRYWI